MPEKLPTLTKLEEAVLNEYLSGRKKFEICARLQITSAQLNAVLAKSSFVKMALEQVAIDAAGEAGRISQEFESRDLSKLETKELVWVRNQSLKAAEMAMKIKEGRNPAAVNILAVINSNLKDSGENNKIIEAEAITDDEFKDVII